MILDTVGLYSRLKPDMTMILAALQCNKKGLAHLGASENDENKTKKAHFLINELKYTV